MAIAYYLDEIMPEAGLLPTERVARAHCRSICGEMNSGFANLRSALPMNLKAHHTSFKIWAGAQPDIDRIVEIWRECLARYGGPYLFGPQRGMADAMYAPVVTRFLTYDVQLDAAVRGLLQDHHGDARDEGVGRRGPEGARRDRGTRHGVLSGQTPHPGFGGRHRARAPARRWS